MSLLGLRCRPATAYLLQVRLPIEAGSLGSLLARLGMRTLLERLLRVQLHGDSYRGLPCVAFGCSRVLRMCSRAGSF